MEGSPITGDERFSFARFAGHPFFKQVNAWLVSHSQIHADSAVVDLACGPGAVTELILGELDESQDFAALVLDLWTSGREAKQVDRAFDDLAERLVQAKKKYSQTKELDETLFQRDFEA